MQSRTLQILGLAWCCLASVPSLCAPGLLAQALLAQGLLARAPATGGQERDAKLPAPLPLTTWRELTDHPGRYTNKRLRLVLQFQAHVATWNPYLTRFGTRDYSAHQFWGDEQRLWNLADYQTAPVRLFAHRRSMAEWTLDAAQPYVRFEVEITVRDVFLDQPWAEIETIRRLDEHVSEGTLIHAARATELMQNKSWKLAENELDQALVGGLPADPKRELEQLREDCRHMNAPRGKAGAKSVPIVRGQKPAIIRPKN